MLRNHSKLEQQLEIRRLTNDLMGTQGLDKNHYIGQTEKQLWADEHSGAQLTDKDRKTQEYKQWRRDSDVYIKEQADLAYTKAYGEISENKIAPMFANRLSHIAESPNMINYFNSDIVTNSFNGLDESPRILEAYRAIDIRDSLKDIQKQISNNVTLRYCAVDRNTTQTPEGLMKGLINVSDKDGRVATGDLETFGEMIDPETGRTTGQRITEFSFGFTTANMKDGAVNDIAPEDMYESVIGINEKERKQYLEMLDRFDKGGIKALTKGEQVTFHRLALYGSDLTKIEDRGNGIFTISSMAEKKNIHGSHDEVAKGIQKLYDVGVNQEATKVNGMYGWEHRLLEAITRIKKEDVTLIGFNFSNFDMKNLAYAVRNKEFTSKPFRDKMYDLVGEALSFEYQIDIFQLLKTNVDDRPGFLREVIAKNDPEYQSGMEKVKQFENEIANLKNQGDSAENNKIIKAKQRELKNLKSSLGQRLYQKDKQLNEWLNDNGRTAFTQEAVLKAIELGGGVKKQGAAHTSTEDSIGVLRIATEQGFLDPDSSEVAKRLMKQTSDEMNAALNLNANAPKLFYANYSSGDLSSHGLVSFTFDNVAKNVVRTSDGVSIVYGKDGDVQTVRESFGQSAIRRRTLYQIGGAASLVSGDPLYQAVAKAHPEQATGKLYALSMQGQNFGEAPKGTNLNHIIVGTKEQLESYLNQNFIHAANAKTDADGKIIRDENKQIVWTTEGVHKEYLKQLKVDGTPNEEILDHLKEENDFALANDAAARDVRLHSFAKDKKMMQLNDAFAEKYSRTAARIRNLKEGSEITIYGDNYSVKDKQLYRNGMKTNFENVMKVFRLYRFDQEYGDLRKNYRKIGYLGVGGTDTAKKPGIFVSIFGYGENQEMLYPEQFRKAQAHANFIYQNQYVYRKALEYAERKGNGDKNLTQMYYAYAMERLEEKSNLSYMGMFDDSLNSIDRSHVGWTKHPRINAEVGNSFEVDIQGFRDHFDKNNNQIMTFDLKNENSGYSMAQKLFTRLGYQKEKLKEKLDSREAQLGVLMDFQQFFAKTTGIKATKENRIHTFDGIDIASQKILNTMRAARKQNPQAGRITEPLSHDIVNSSHENFGMTNRTTDSVIDSIENVTFYNLPGKGTIETLPDGTKKYKYFLNTKDEKYRNYKHGVVNDLLNKVSYRVQGLDSASTDDNSFIQRMIKDHGVSKADAERMRDAQKLTRKSMQSFLGDLVDSISSNGGSLSIDPDSHRVFVIDPMTKKQTELDIPMISEGHNGIITVKRGNMGAPRVNQLGFVKDRFGNVKVGTRFDQAYSNTGWALHGSSFNRNVERDGLGEAVNKGIKNVFKTLNELMMVQNENAQEFVMANSFDFHGVPSLLKYVSDSTVASIAEHDNSHSKVFVDLLNNKDKLQDLENLDDLAPHELSSVAEFLPHIMNDKGVLNQFTDVEQDIIKNVNWRKIEKPGFVRQYNSLSQPGEYSHAGANKIDAKLAQAVPLDGKNMKRFEELGYGYVGSPIETNYSATRQEFIARNTGRQISTKVTATTLSINTEDFQKIIDTYATDEEKQSIPFSTFAGGSTNEGSAISDAEAEDLGFKDYLKQSVKVDDLTESTAYKKQFMDGVDQDDGRKLNLQNTVNTFKKVKGNYVYSPGQTAVVRAGDKLFTKYSNYGKGETVYAKQDGFLRQAWFSDGVELTEDRLNELVATSDKDFESVIDVKNYLSKLGYTEKFVIDPLNISGTPKLAQADEKVMTRSTRMALGTYDENLREFFNDNLKLKDADNRFSLVGKFLDYDVINELQNFNGDSKEFAKTKFYLALQNAQEAAIRSLNKGRKDKFIERAIRKGVMSPEEVLEQINTAYGNAEGFSKAIFDERYAGSRLLQDILHRSGIVSDPSQRIAIVSNIGPGAKKHGSVFAIDQLINNMKRIDKYGTESGKQDFFERLKQNGWDVGDDISQYGKLFNDEKYKPIVNKTIADILQPISETFTYQNGRLIDNNQGQNYGYNTEAIQDIAQRFFGGSLTKTTKDGVTYAVTDNGFSQLPNVDRPGTGIAGVRNSQEMRYDERMAHNIRTHILSATQAEGVLSDDVTKKMIASSPLMQGFEEYMNKSIGSTYLDEVSRKFAEHVFYTEGQKRVYDKYVEESGNKTDMKVIEKERAAVYDDLQAKGMTPKQIDVTIDAMKQNGAPTITGDRVLAMHSAASYGMAREFNRGAVSADKLIDTDNFRSMNIADANDAKELTSIIDDNALRGQAYLLNFKDQELLDLQVGTNPNKKFGLLKDSSIESLAVPFLEVGAKDSKGEYISSGVSGKISRFIGLRNDLIDRMKILSGQPDVDYEHDEQVNDLRNQMQTLIEDTRTEISKTATRKGGIFGRAANAHLTDGVTYLSAEGFSFSGTGSDGLFNKFSLNGVNLSEQAKKFLSGESAMDLDFTIVNNNLRDQYYSLDRLTETLGGDKKLAKELQGTIFNDLKTEGTLTTVTRHPTQQNRSTGASALFFNDNVAAGHMYINERSMEQRKGDFDSDRLFGSIIKARANITVNGQTFSREVDYAAYRALKKLSEGNKALSVSLHKDDTNVFLDAMKDTLVGSKYSNPVAQGISELDPETTRKRVSNAALSVSADDFANLTWDGKRTINYARTYTPEQENALSKDYNTITSNFRNNYVDTYGSEAFDALKDDKAKYQTKLYDYAKSTYSEAKADDVLHFGALHQAHTTYNEAVMSKNSAGILNDVLYRMDRIATLASQKNATPTGAIFTAPESNLMRAGFEALQEATLSGKNEKGFDIERVVKLQNISRDMSSYMMGMNKGVSADALRANVVDFFKPIFVSRAGKEFSRSIKDGAGSIPDIMDAARTLVGEGFDDLTDEQKAGKAAELMADMVIRVSTNKDLTNAFRNMVSKEGLDYDKRVGLIRVSNSPAEKALSTANAISNNTSGIDITPEVEGPQASKAYRASEQLKERVAEIKRAQQDAKKEIAVNRQNQEEKVDAAKEIVSHTSERLQNGARRISRMFRGHAGLSAIAGVAAGLVTAGYASPGFSNHAAPAPATTQAAGASTDEQEMVATMAPVPNLSDANMNVMRGGPSSGYVININATSPDGKDAAVAAVKNAASTMTPQSGSINVSVNTSASDSLNQLQVNRMVANAFGIA